MPPVAVTGFLWLSQLKRGTVERTGEQLQLLTNSQWDEEARHLADVALLLLDKHRSHPSSTVTRSLLRHLCREIEDHCPRYVSIAARDRAAALGLSDLREYHWDEQPHRMKDHGREIFHWDHFVPVSQLQRQLEEQGALATQERTFGILRRARIAWILKAEDEDLTRRGFRSHRDNPYKAYDDVKISLLHVHDSDPDLWGH